LLHVAEPLHGDRLGRGVLATEHSAATVGGVGVAQVEHAKALVRRGEVGEEIAQALAAHALEALGHEGAAGVLAGGDVFAAQLVVTAE